MNDKSYIEKLLSHIGNKEQKQKIRYELTDHITEKQKWYEELEYDPETAALRAEEDMGDADVVGEQFNVQNDNVLKSLWYYVIMPTIPFVIFFIALFTDIYSEENLIKFTAVSATLMFICLYVCIKRMKPVCVVLYTVSVSIYLELFDYIYYIWLFVTGATYCGEKYLDITVDIYKERMMFGFYVEDIFNLVLLALLFVPCIISVIIIIKTKMLKNRKYDYYIIKGIRIGILILIFLFVILSCLIIHKATAFESSYKTEAIESINKVNSVIIDKIYRYKSGEKLDVSDIGNIEIESLVSEDNEEYYRIDDIRVDFYSSITVNYSDYDNISEIRTCLAEQSYGYPDNPVFNSDVTEELTAFARKGGSIKEAPELFSLYYYESKDLIILVYYSELGTQTLTFSWQDGDFVLTDANIRSERLSSLPEKMMVQYSDAMKKFLEKEYHEARDMFPDAECHLETVTYGIYRNDIDGTYEFVQDYQLYYMTDYRDYENRKIYVSEDLLFAGDVLKVRFTDNGTEIIRSEELDNKDMEIGLTITEWDKETKDNYDLYNHNFSAFSSHIPDERKASYTIEIDGIKSDKPFYDKYCETWTYHDISYMKEWYGKETHLNEEFYYG
ncbi:MAG: hypothetical protein MJ168_04180 [Clostridia bacterium]|nr:hypothetical protein [Clostridia bacterium]